jgi:hypothetical protein
MTGTVTVSPARCEACGAPLFGRRRQTRTCNSACRQRAYRRRHSETVTRPPRPVFSAREWALLRDRVARAKVAREEREQAAADALLRAEDWWAA